MVRHDSLPKVALFQGHDNAKAYTGVLLQQE
jgi:hypothetical protein